MSEEEKKEVLDQEKDLNADELDEAAGGLWCSCSIGGGGKGDYAEKTCACVMGGGGEYTEYGEWLFGKKTRCACVGYGYGNGD